MESKLLNKKILIDRKNLSRNKTMVVVKIKWTSVNDNNKEIKSNVAYDTQVNVPFMCLTWLLSICQWTSRCPTVVCHSYTPAGLGSGLAPPTSEPHKTLTDQQTI